MKNHILQRKQRDVIPYFSRKDLQQRFDWEALKSVSQLFQSEAEIQKFKELCKDPTSCVAKAVRAGRKAHAALETGIAKDELNQAILDAFEVAFDKDLDEVWGVEQWLAHPLGFKGRFDGVGVFRGKLTVFDHKKTNKRKTRKQLSKYFDQLVAYKIAHNYLYPEFEIEQVAILNVWGVSPDEVAADSTVVDSDELVSLENDFTRRLA